MNKLNQLKDFEIKGINTMRTLNFFGICEIIFH
jgi:hypothetical protein